MSRPLWARSRPWALAGVAVLGAAYVLVTVPAWGQPSTALVVNEVYGGGGNTGSFYNRDFIELTNRGAEPADVAGLSVQYHSSSATGAWQVTPLAGVIDPGALFLIGEATGTGGQQQPLPAVDVSGTIAMSATAGTVALVEGTTALTCTADTCAAETRIVDLVGFGTAAIRETNPVPGASNTTSVQRRATPDTDDNSNDLFAAEPSPKAANVEPEPEVCPAEPGPTRIHDIQGDGWLSPIRGATVTDVPGVVTGVRAAGSSRGFWIQDPAPDSNPATSEGIFVFTSSAPITVQEGDAVMVSGRVQNFYPLFSGEVLAETSNLSITEISSVTSVLVCSTDNPVPAAEVVTGASLPETYAASSPTGNIEDLVPVDPTRSVQEFWRSRLGMRVQVADVRVVGPGNEFGEVYVTVKPDESPSARGGTLVTGYDSPTGRIVVFPVTGSVSPANVGDTLDGPTAGPVDYILFGGFGIAATTVGALHSNDLPRQVAATPAEDQLSVATYNVENLTVGDPASKFTALAEGVVNSLQSPDIVTLEEIQDNTGETDDGIVDADATLDRFVEAIVTAGGPAYEWRQINPVDGDDGGAPGGNIRVAFLFNPARVSFVDRPGGGSLTAVSAVAGADGPELSFSPGRIDPTNAAWENSRKPLVGEFVFGGETVFVVANHFNSKGGDQNADGRFQPPTRGSEVQRQLQAAAVRDFANQILAVDAQASIVVAGDLNDYQFSPALATLTAGGLVALVNTLPADQQYTYVFNGFSQVLDHIVVSPALLDPARWGLEYEIVHINAEFSDQASDHDPQVVRLRPVPPPTCDRVVTGIHLGSLIQNAGTLCLEGAQQLGVVTISTGARLVVSDSLVVGKIVSTGAAGLTVCGTNVAGAVEISGSTGPVRLGGTDCAGGEILGAVKLTGNTGGVVVGGNRILGVLACSGNVPPPTNDGTPNQVLGARTGQCASL